MVIDKNDYMQNYYDNEADANKHMSYVNAAAALLSMVMWVLYLAKIFTIPDHFFLTILIMFPILSAILCIPLFFVKNEAVLRKPGYKVFILTSLLIAIAALNITIPKHSVLFWPFTILIANHYYNPKFGRIIYVITIVLMLICMYGGMFLGEFDENLFGGGVIKGDTIGTVETIEERYQLLQERIAEGNNRYIKVLLFYYFPRAIIVTLFFMVSNLLNKRTYKLLDEEIKVHDQQEKTKTELEVAKEIQLNTLPAEIVDDSSVEIVGELKAAKEVGGDLYDYIDIDENHVALLIGDVSGKGVPAAMFMMKTITSFRAYAKGGKTPSEILRDINSAILKGNQKSMFVTCFLAILDRRDGHIVYANAGHNPPIIGSNRNFRFLKSNPGLLLGCFKDTYVKDEEITLNKGDSIILYTDGVTEARNINGDFFGEQRLLNVANKEDYTCIIDFHHSLKDEIAEFVQEAPQSDDITFVTMKYRGNNYAYKEKKFSAKKENILGMLNFIEEFGNENNFPESFKNKLVIVGDELLSNIVKYGYEDNGGEIFVRLLFNKDNNEFVLTIIDRAKAFNQLEVDNSPYDANGNKPLKVGGLGLLIVKKIMTEYAYDRINGKNILVLKKRFEKE